MPNYDDEPKRKPDAYEADESLYPDGFDDWNPQRQKSWLKSQIALLEPQVAELEEDYNKKAIQNRQSTEKLDQITADLKKRGRGKRRPGFFDGLAAAVGGLGDAVVAGIAGQTLEAARQQLIELKARLAGIESADSKQHSPQEHRAQRLAAVAALKAECEQACAGISDPLIKNTVKAAYEDKIQKELQKL